MLTEAQVVVLRRESERAGASVAELIRRTVDDRYGTVRECWCVWSCFAMRLAERRRTEGAHHRSDWIPVDHAIAEKAEALVRRYPRSHSGY